MYLIMNMACAGPDDPAPGDSNLPQFMTVDSVRVYRKAQQTRCFPAAAARHAVRALEFGRVDALFFRGFRRPA
jgi:hypothetical protein